MTEYYKEDFYNEYAIKKGDTTIAIVDSGSNARRIVECLNNLHKQIKQLKQSGAKLGIQNDGLIMENYTLREKIKELEKENEQLRELLNIGKTNAKDLIDVLNIQEERIETYRQKNEQLREVIDKLFDYFDKWFEEERGVYIEEFGMLWKDICMGDVE